MSSFCLPCWPGAARSHFNTDDELLPSTAVRETKPAEDEEDLRKPTPAEYAGETAKKFLKVLEAVAEDIPVPGLSRAVKLATSLINACDETHMTLERAQELKLRIKTLVTLLVDELKDKKKGEIQETLEKDVEALLQDLTYIQTKLEEIASQHTLLVVFFQGLNEEKVRKCVDRLNTSMERFNLAREIGQANFLDHFERQIIIFHSNHQRSLNNLENGMSKVLAILDGHQSATSSLLQSQSRAGVPANVNIFYGRDSLVAELARILTDPMEGRKHPRVCLLGPGGMGKTSTALATMAHSDVKTYFPDGNCVWIPCVKATTFSLFLETLYQSLGITRNSGNTRNDILAELNASERLVLLLDNFETPWNIDGGRSEVERILRDLDHILHITLFITMRSSIPPCEGIHWDSVDLRAVDTDAAHQIYSDIYPDGGKDPKLSELLNMIGHMPLAVTMMAKIGKVTRLPAERLIVEYTRLGTAMLGQGSDAEHSMDICIGLSVDSPPMEKHPEALDLLMILAVLPVGTTYAMLTSTWACMSPNLVGALEVLSETSLVEQRGSRYFVLPVIRHYLLNPCRFPKKIRRSMIKSACNFLMQHKSSPGDVSYNEHTTAILSEAGNLEAILLDTTIPTPELINALLVLANHQKETRPRTDVIEHALKLVHAMDDSATLSGHLLFCYGGILRGRGNFEDAIKQYTLAHKTFLSVSKKTQAAECLLQLADIHRYTENESYEVRKALIEAAKSDFQSFNDTRGVAICLYHLGSLHWMNPQYSEEAEDQLTCAMEMLKGLQEKLYLAHCSQHLGFLYFITARYEDAQTAYMFASKEYEKIGHYDTRAQRGLSRISIVKGDYNGAIHLLMRTLERSKSHGDPLDIAWTLLGMGRCWEKMGNKVDARGAFEEGRRYYSSLHTTSSDESILVCNFFIKRLEDSQLIPNFEEKQAWLSAYPEDKEEIQRK